ncbi:MAG: hypothetical protein M3Z95_05320 [Actinomycetota bacterium]|nr:hypothetical protein [Actinomycetota bacterium]
MKPANADLVARDLPPLSNKLTPHSLRRAFASIFCELGELPTVLVAEMVHTSPTLDGR